MGFTPPLSKILAREGGGKSLFDPKIFRLRRRNTCFYTCMYDAFIYVPRYLTMMHVCMMHISMMRQILSRKDILSLGGAAGANKAILGVGYPTPRIALSVGDKISAASYTHAA